MPRYGVPSWRKGRETGPAAWAAFHGCIHGRVPASSAAAMASVTRVYTSDFKEAVLAVIAIHLGSSSSRPRAKDARHGAAGAALQGRGRDALPGAPPWAEAAGGRRAPARRAAARQGATGSRSPKGPGEDRGDSVPWRASGGAQGRVAKQPPGSARGKPRVKTSATAREGEPGTAVGGGTGAGIAPEAFHGPRARRERAAYRDVNRGFAPRTDGAVGIEPSWATERRFRPPAGDGPAIPITYKETVFIKPAAGTGHRKIAPATDADHCTMPFRHGAMPPRRRSRHDGPPIDGDPIRCRAGVLAVRS